MSAGRMEHIHALFSHIHIRATRNYILFLAWDDDFTSLWMCAQCERTGCVYAVIRDWLSHLYQRKTHSLLCVGPMRGERRLSLLKNIISFFLCWIFVFGWIVNTINSIRMFMVLFFFSRIYFDLNYYFFAGLEHAQSLGCTRKKKETNSSLYCSEDGSLRRFEYCYDSHKWCCIEIRANHSLSHAQFSRLILDPNWIIYFVFQFLFVQFGVCQIVSQNNRTNTQMTTNK